MTFAIDNIIGIAISTDQPLYPVILSNNIIKIEITRVCIIILLAILLPLLIEYITVTHKYTILIELINDHITFASVKKSIAISTPEINIHMNINIPI